MTASSLPHPETFFPDLTNDRLECIATRLLDVRHATFREMNSVLDDNYTRESTAFGRSRNMLIQTALSGQFPWLSLKSPGMDVTFAIGVVPCRFFRDDPDAPEKPGFFKRNAVDDLFSVDESQPVLWRFVVEKAMTEEAEDRVFLFGYNAYQEKVSYWEYSANSTVLHSIDADTPASADIPPANVEVREDDVAEIEADRRKTGNEK